MDNTTLIEYTQGKPLSELSIANIAYIIDKNWRKTSKNGIYFGAKPYLEAMYSLNTIQDNYIHDSGRSIVTYFLANAQTWKSEVAKAIKLHLNKLIK